MYAIAVYGVQYLVAGCRSQVQGSKAAASLFLDAHPATLQMNPTASNQALHTIGGNSIHIV